MQRVEYATPLGYGGRLLPNNAAKAALIFGIAVFFLLLLGAIVGTGSGSTFAAQIFIAILILLAPILAIICGIVGVTQTRDGRHSGKGMSITGISLGGVGLLLAIIGVGSALLAPSYSSSCTSPRVRCAANLKQIGLAMQLYANENKGLYPPRPEDLLLTQDITTDIFVCPSTNDTWATGATTQQAAANLSAGGHDSYIYLGAGKNSNTPANVVLVYEPLQDHGNGMNVLFADGHVDFVSGAMAQKVEAELEAGQNPPPSYHP